MELAIAIKCVPAVPGAYVLQGVKGLHYTGAARNLRERLKDHLAGRARRTRNQRPLALIFWEPAADYTTALAREKFLKSGAGRLWLKTEQTVSP